MPKNKSALNDDKNYHAQIKRLEKEALELGRYLKFLQQQEKDIQSGKRNISRALRIILYRMTFGNGSRASRGRFKNIRDEISKLESAHVEKAVKMMRLDEAWKREVYRRGNCPMPSKKCPVSPIRADLTTKATTPPRRQNG
jgi:hypothetical protein